MARAAHRAGSGAGGAQLPIAIVTGVRGNVRHRVVECIGSAGHSGAVPRWLRHDAMFATSELVSHLDRHWRTLLDAGATWSSPSALSRRIPASTPSPASPESWLQLRSAQPEQGDAEAFHDLFLSECGLVGEERGVEFKLDRRLESSPATMDSGWIARLRAAARTLGLPDEEMPSGAGHDAAVFANAGIPSAMIFVRNEHGSHNPDELMKIEDFAAGVAVMRRHSKRRPHEHRGAFRCRPNGFRCCLRHQPPARRVALRLRDGALLTAVLPDTAAQFARSIHYAQPRAARDDCRACRRLWRRILTARGRDVRRKLFFHGQRHCAASQNRRSRRAGAPAPSSVPSPRRAMHRFPTRKCAFSV